MKATTEYRDAYCWFFGSQRQGADTYEDMIKGKIAGTYSEPEAHEFKFDFETREKAPPPRPASTSKTASSGKSSRKSRRDNSGSQKDPRSDKRYQNDGSLRASFTNYGEGNINPPNDKLYMTTFNVKSPTGVNPHTVMKNRIRPRVYEQYRYPVAGVANKNQNRAKPKFIPGDDIIHNATSDVDGPFYVYWPSEEPFPSQYRDLEKIVRP